MARFCRSLLFNPDLFVAQIAKFPDILTKPEPALKLGKAGWWLVVAAYYAWILYLAAAVYIGLTSLLTAVLALIISPLIIMSVLYLNAWLLWNFYFRFKSKSADKK